MIDLTRVTGALLILGGLGAAAFFLLAFDVSVETDGGHRVVNLGLMADRQNRIMFGLGTAIVGGIIFAVGRKRQPASAPQVAAPQSPSGPKDIPDPVSSGLAGYRVRPPKPVAPPRDLKDIEKGIDWDKA